MTYKNWREEDLPHLGVLGRFTEVRRGENTTGQWISKIKRQIEDKGHNVRMAMHHS